MAAPAVPEPPSAAQSYGVHVSLWGIDFTIPLSKPALYIVVSLLAAAAAVVTASRYYVLVQKTVWSDVRNDATAYAQLLPNTELGEFMKHFGETPKTTMPGPAGVQMAYYSSDGCILVTRSSPGRPDTKHWVLDLSKVALPAPPSPPPMPNNTGSLAQPRVENSQSPLLAELEMPALGQSSSKVGPSAYDLHDRLELASDATSPLLHPVQGGHCLAQHPGEFQWWYGQVNGCFVQVWRKWPDGCTHFQWYNRCYNYFDPGITWTACVH
jgi:hypothetical protein